MLKTLLYIQKLDVAQIGHTEKTNFVKIKLMMRYLRFTTVGIHIVQMLTKIHR